MNTDKLLDLTYALRDIAHAISTTTSEKVKISLTASAKTIVKEISEMFID